MESNPISDEVNIVNKGPVLGPKEFLVNAQKELARIKRYGGRTTFLLIKPTENSDEIKGDYLETLYHSINKQLRQCDSLYIFDSNSIAAILPETHEAGGETASVRIKRKISQAIVGKNTPITTCIGVVSVWPEECPGIKELLQELKKDLERDEKCQYLPQEQGICASSSQKICLLVEKEADFAKLLKELKGEYALLDKSQMGDASLVVADTRYCREKGIDTDFERINSRLRYTFELKEKNNTLLVASERPLELIKCIKALCSLGPNGEYHEKNLEKKFKDILSTIGSSTHQLNQPLQIMMGKIELLLLDLSLEGEISKTQLQKALKEIKKQVHYAAEINTKINRLTKA